MKPSMWVRISTQCSRLQVARKTGRTNKDLKWTSGKHGHNAEQNRQNQPPVDGNFKPYKSQTFLPLEKTQTRSEIKQKTKSYSRLIRLHNKKNKQKQSNERERERLEEREIIWQRAVDGDEERKRIGPLVRTWWLSPCKRFGSRKLRTGNRHRSLWSCR